MITSARAARPQRPIHAGGPLGFSLFEFAVVSAVLALLVGIFVNRAYFYRERAESVAAEQLIATLRSALLLKVSHLTVTGKTPEIAALLDENPMLWLASTPKNYLGEYYSPDIGHLPRATWYYDRNEKTLVYLLNIEKSFAPEPSNLLKFKVKSIRLPLTPAKLASARDPIESVVLDQVFDEATVNKK